MKIKVFVIALLITIIALFLYGIYLERTWNQNNAKRKILQSQIYLGMSHDQVVHEIDSLNLPVIINKTNEIVVRVRIGLDVRKLYYTFENNKLIIINESEVDLVLF